jgi:hypothetical protein
MTPTPPRPRTAAQRDAARRNGANSRGPTTEEGKARSRGNALKHGFRGDGTVLPEEMRAELEAEILTFTRVLKPRDEVEQRLVERAALASVRFLWIAHAEHQAVAEGRRTAIARWDAERAAERRRWAEILEPAGPGTETTPRPNPAEALAALLQTGDGCRWLSARWRALGAILESRGWDGAEALRAARLRGRSTAGARPMDGAALRAFWADVAAARASTPAGAAARQRLRGWIAERRRALRRRARRLWQTIDGPNRAAAPALAACDPSPEAVRRARHYSDAERMGRLSLAALDARRRAARAAQRDGIEPEAFAPGARGFAGETLERMPGDSGVSPTKLRAPGVGSLDPMPGPAAVGRDGPPPSVDSVAAMPAPAAEAPDEPAGPDAPEGPNAPAPAPASARYQTNPAPPKSLPEKGLCAAQTPGGGVSDSDPSVPPMGACWLDHPHPTPGGVRFLAGRADGG